MATIVFCMSRQEGHLLPTFKLASALKARGHTVHYLSVPDMQEFVEKRGHGFVPVLGRVCPRGTRAELARMSPSDQARHIEKTTRGIFEAIANGALEPVLEHMAPDLLVVDANRAIVALSAYKLGIPAVSLSTCLPMARAPGIPPSTSPIVPQPGPLGRLRVQAAWTRVKLERNLWARNSLIPFTFRMTGRAAQRCGYPRRWLDTDSHIAPRLATLTELVLCPREFDFPRPESPSRIYIEASVEQDREEDPDGSPWHRLAGPGRLLYCSFGSQSFRYDSIVPMTNALFEVMRRRPSDQLVLAAGMRAQALGKAGCPSNVLVVDWAPQLRILSRASVMITHGGLGAIKESILAGVPMIVFPQCYDQHGNAARVAYHGLGVVGDPKRISESYVESLLHAVETDPSYATKMNAMRDAFARAEARGAGVAVIEKMLGQRPSLQPALEPSTHAT